MGLGQGWKVNPFIKPREVNSHDNGRGWTGGHPAHLYSYRDKLGRQWSCMRFAVLLGRRAFAFGRDSYLPTSSLWVMSVCAGEIAASRGQPHLGPELLLAYAVSQACEDYLHQRFREGPFIAGVSDYLCDVPVPRARDIFMLSGGGE